MKFLTVIKFLIIGFCLGSSYQKWITPVSEPPRIQRTANISNASIWAGYRRNVDCDCCKRWLDYKIPVKVVDRNYGG
jgi:hypothetical protein